MPMKLGTENVLKHLLERYIRDANNHVVLIMFFVSYCILTRLGSIMVRFINKMKLCG